MPMKRHLAPASAVMSGARRRANIQAQGARRSGGRTVGGRLVAGVLAGSLAGSLLLAPAAPAAPAAPVTPVDTAGRITKVVDGDTVRAKIDGEKGTVPIRITGLNAMEKGQCHARQATDRLEKLLLKEDGRTGRRVLITARDAASKSGDRLRRSLAVKDASGKWIDPAAVLVREGLALWLPNKVEYLPNYPRGDKPSYPALAKKAAAKGRGLWNTDACGAGPAQNAKLRVSVQEKGPETVSIKNQGTKPVSLANWWVRDSSYHGEDGRGYQFPAGTVVPGGGTVFLHVNGDKEDNGDGDYYWGLPDNVHLFDNVTKAPVHRADGAYLFDPQGDLRAAHQYAPHAPIQFP